MHTAQHLGLHTLFHYQRYVQDHVRSVLLDNKVRFSNPANFNDPWDCRPAFATRLEDRHYVGRVVEYFNAIGRKQGLSADDIAKLEARMWGDPPFLEAMILDYERTMAQVIGVGYRVYCLARRADHSLMWGHYADSHRGVCLEFSVKSDTFAGAQEVVYRGDRDVVDLDDDDPIRFVGATLLTKADYWGYEEELRLVSREKESEEGMLVSSDGFVGFAPDALAGVYVGCMAPEGTVNEIVAMAKERPSMVPVYRMTRDRTQYRLAGELVHPPS